MLERKIKDAYYKLYRWIERQSFVGYDPYDALNTDISLLKKNKYFRLLFNYTNKFSPINLRKIFKIKKSKSNKALALMCSGLLRFPPNEKTYKIINKHVDYILSKSLISKYGYHCWNAHDFSLQMTSGYSEATTPDIIGTEACASSIFKQYQNNKSNTLLKTILFSVKDYFLNTLLVRKNGAIFFKYRPLALENDCIYNASLIGAKYISKINAFFNSKVGNDIIIDCYRYVVSKQNNDGSWHYGIDLRTNYQKKQIDFHQGYILDAIWEYLTIGDYDWELIQSYLKGIHFYFSKQFDSNGMSRYRYPRKYPVDIHNQAQGIITFSKAGRFDEKYLKFAKTIAVWTINNMQDDSGYFYYQKYPFMTNKIPYMRWGQAWMLYALSNFLHYSREGNKSSTQLNI